MCKRTHKNCTNCMKCICLSGRRTHFKRRNCRAGCDFCSHPLPFTCRLNAFHHVLLVGFLWPCPVLSCPFGPLFGLFQAYLSTYRRALNVNAIYLFDTHTQIIALHCRKDRKNTHTHCQWILYIQALFDKLFVRMEEHSMQQYSEKMEPTTVAIVARIAYQLRPMNATQCFFDYAI